MNTEEEQANKQIRAQVHVWHKRVDERLTELAALNHREDRASISVKVLAEQLLQNHAYLVLWAEVDRRIGTGMSPVKALQGTCQTIMLRILDGTFDGEQLACAQVFLKESAEILRRVNGMNATVSLV
jgi:seryl-tRNA(Sec) selenium transferase